MPIPFLKKKTERELESHLKQMIRNREEDLEMIKKIEQKAKDKKIKDLAKKMHEQELKNIIEMKKIEKEIESGELTK